MGTNKPTLGHCRDCQAPIMFAKHVRTGFDNKLDIQPHPNGNALVDRLAHALRVSDWRRP